MSANHFFLGLAAGAAMLAVPVIAVGGSPLSLADRLGHWVDGSPQAPLPLDTPEAARPFVGHEPGQPTPTSLPLPTIQLQPTTPPTPTPVPPRPSSTPLPLPPTPTPPAAPQVAQPGRSAPAPPAMQQAAGFRSAFINSGADGAYVRKAAGVSVADDTFLPEGSAILVNPTAVIHIADQNWVAVRAAPNVIGWLPADVIRLDTSQTAAQAAAPQAPAQIPQAAVPTPYRVNPALLGGLDPYPTLTPRPSPTPQPPATPAVALTTGDLSRLVVANTDGQGVALRNSPNLDDTTPVVIPEGGGVTVLAWNTTEWVQVKTDGGVTGWIPTTYLAVPESADAGP